MIFFQKSYCLSVLSFFYGSFLVCSQEQTVSVNLLRSIATLSLWTEQWHKLNSSRDRSKESEKQLVLEFKPDQRAQLSFSCSRLDSDTLLLFSGKTEGKGKVVVSSCRSIGDFADQINAIVDFIKHHNNKISDTKLLVLFCQRDRDRLLQEKDFLKNYEAKLKEITSSDPEVIGYRMIPGQSHRNRDHFECQIDESKVFWRSAIDNFKHHNL